MSASVLSLRRSSRIATNIVRSAVATVQEDVTSSTMSLRRSLSVSTLSSLSPVASDSESDRPRPAKRARVRGPEANKDSIEPGATQKARQRRKADIPEYKIEDFVTRSTNTWKIGPHVSSAGGVENAIINAASVGANAFAIFLKSQRKWDSNALKEESISKFKERMKSFGYSPSHILPHGNYLVNLGNPDEEKREKSFTCFLDDLKRCEQLGLRLYNFHPGSTVGAGTTEESLALIAECINRAHAETDNVVIVLENMAGSGNVIGSRFSELGEIIRQVRDKTRVGACLDTCHMYAAGYDITTKEGWETTMEEFDREVGIGYLRGMHLNDSKAALGSKKDRHENIGLGHLGLRTFVHILADPRTRDIPLILETPAYDVQAGSSTAVRERLAMEGMGVWRTEVAVLNRLSGRAGGKEGEVDVEEDELADARKEIEQAVQKASKLRDAKGKKVDGADTKAKRKSKRKRSAIAEDDMEEAEALAPEDDDRCC